VVFAALVATSAIATAEQVYENVDEAGAVEFSDHASPSAKSIDVKPNVIEVTPVAPIEASAPVPRSEAAAVDGEIELDVTHQGVVDDYDDELARRRVEARSIGVEPVRTEVAPAPVHHEAVHEGGHRR
jgi:hypothetical protein